MRKQVLSLICLPFLVYCSGKESSQLVYSKESDVYKIEIATIQTKIDSRGVAQCSKYTKTSRNDTIFDSYGLSLPRILAYSLETTEKYLNEIPIDSLDNKYLKVKIENFSDQPINYDSVLYLGLSEAFNLEAIPSKKRVEGYQLNVIDHAALARQKVECGISSIKYNDGVFSGEAMKLKGLTGVVDQYVDPCIQQDNNHQQCYAIDFIVNKDFEKINDKLIEYGLRFDPATFEQTFYQVNPAVNSNQSNKP